MFAVEMLPADYGDCLWIEYGPQEKPHRILLDTGTPGTFPALKNRIESLPSDQRSFELLVISHVDDDHIGGVLRLMKERASMGVEFRDIWFNGYIHLEQAEEHQEEDVLGANEDDVLGPVQGEELTRLLADQKQHWNRAFDGRPIMVTKGSLPTVDLEGMTVRLLSPGREQLTNLLPKWKDVVIAAGLVPGQTGDAEEDTQDTGEEDVLGEQPLDVEILAKTQFKEDTAVANGSSIAFLAQFEGKSILLGADAFPSVILRTLERVQTSPSSRVKLDALKLPHHGSRANISPALLAAVECERFLVSSSGKKFRHPNREAIARSISSQPQKNITFHFNYRSQFNEIWDDESLMGEYAYAVEFPEQKNAGLRVEL